MIIGIMAVVIIGLVVKMISDKGKYEDRLAGCKVTIQGLEEILENEKKIRQQETEYNVLNEESIRNLKEENKLLKDEIYEHDKEIQKTNESIAKVNNENVRLMKTLNRLGLGHTVSKSITS